MKYTFFFIKWLIYHDNTNHKRYQYIKNQLFNRIEMSLKYAHTIVTNKVIKPHNNAYTSDFYAYKNDSHRIRAIIEPYP